MTREDGREFLRTAAEIGLRPKTTAFPLEQANEALLALKRDAIDGAAVMVIDDCQGQESVVRSRSSGKSTLENHQSSICLG